MKDWDNIESIINKYLNGEINVNYICEDFIKVSLEDRKKYNIKPFYNWKNKEIINDDFFNDLVDYIKIHNLSTLFLLDVSNLLKRGFTWNEAVIFYYNNRKPTHPKIRNYLLQKKRGFITY